MDLTLKEDDGKTLKLIRTKKAGKSTTKGRSSLTLEWNGKTFTGDDAESELACLLQLTPEEYYARTHLHQEVIRDLLFSQIADRSAMIDRMLGLYRLRQLIESLSISIVDREVKDAEKDIQGANQEKETLMRVLEQSKRDLQALSDELSRAGVPPEKTDLVFFVKRLEIVHQALVKLAELVECKIQRIDAPKTIDEARQIPLVIWKELTQIEDRRIGVYGSLQKELAEIDRLHDEYKNALDEQAKLKVEPTKLIKEKTIIHEKLMKLNEKEKEIKDLIVDLVAEANITSRIIKERKTIYEGLKVIKQVYGDRQAIDAAFREQEDRFRKADQAIEHMGLAAKLIALSTQYFQILEDDICPVCESRISVASVRTSLENRLKAQKEARAIKELQEELNKLNAQMQKLRTASQTFDELTVKLESNGKQIDERRKKLSALGLDASQLSSPEQLLSFIKNQLDESKKQVIKIGEDIREAERLNIELENVEKKLSAFFGLERKLQSLINAPLKGQELLLKLKLYRKNVDDKANNVAKLGERASEIREAVTSMRLTIDFLIKRADIEQMKGVVLPGVIRKLEVLTSKLQKMQDLGTAIHDIHDAAISAQQDFLVKTMGALQKDINKAYCKLVPHPHFGTLELEPEELRGRYVYRIKACSTDGKDRTYVQTRFSLAQMNVTAIALFLAIARRMPCGFLIFDDPSQSLDLEHKKALVDVMTEIGVGQQLIVATQDAEFQEELKRAQTKFKAQLIEFGTWTTNGPKLSPPHE